MEIEEEALALIQPQNLEGWDCQPYLLSQQLGYPYSSSLGPTLPRVCHSLYLLQLLVLDSSQCYLESHLVV